MARILGYHVLSLRIRRGWSQEQLSEKSGVYRNGICRIETGKGNPRLGTLIKLFDALGYKMELKLKRWVVVAAEDGDDG